MCQTITDEAGPSTSSHWPVRRDGGAGKKLCDVIKIATLIRSRQMFGCAPASFVTTSSLYFGMRRQLMFERCLEGVTPWGSNCLANHRNYYPELRISPNQPASL